MEKFKKSYELKKNYPPQRGDRFFSPVWWNGRTRGASGGTDGLVVHQRCKDEQHEDDDDGTDGDREDLPEPPCAPLAMLERVEALGVVLEGVAF